ncbi:MAG: RNA-binding protein [Clostridia bacterium]|nr:RNA-binding protein [Clostridia bacterium]
MTRIIPAFTAFLDVRQQSLLTAHFRYSPDTRPVFPGGYEDAERRVCAFLPEYLDEADFAGISAIRVQTAAALPKPLTHRDYLGALMGMGLRRETVGDILVRQDGADILILSDIQDFLLSNFEQAGRARFRAVPISFDALTVPQAGITVVRETVSTLRLDSVVSAAFRLSRGNAAAYIEAGRVFVNGMEIIKKDQKVAQGDKITLRGKGKAVLRAVLGVSKKDRIFIEIEQYK